MRRKKEKSQSLFTPRYSGRLRAALIMHKVSQPSPSSLTAKRGGSARRRFVSLGNTSWSPAPVYPQNLSVPFYGAPPLRAPSPNLMPENSRQKKSTLPPPPDVKPILYGHEMMKPQRHRQPFRSSFQSPAPAVALRTEFLYTSGSPRYSANLGKGPGLNRPSHSANSTRNWSPRTLSSRASPRASPRPMSALSYASTPASIITSLHISNDEVPSSPRSRFFDGCAPFNL